MTYTKTQIEEALKRVDDIYRGKVEDRYTGLKESECTTDIEKVFWSVVTDERFEYKTKKGQYEEIFKRLGIESNKHKTFEKKFEGGVIIRNLPADHKYTLLNSGSFAEGEGWCCENCGTFIRHWSEVRDEQTGKLHLVGMECIKTVVKYDDTNEWRISQQLAEATKIRKLIREAKKRIDAGTIHVEDKDSYRYYIDEGNRTWAYIRLDELDRFERKGVKQPQEE